ncbi:polysaccharide deacetylase family protein, partial [Streptomyces sp. NPDC059466]|uniref:polysaccharide deacetylase family protein n=1 Tax=Streptomyces sp. NPDC059466 TaxID=3346843 RepID=UPI00368B24C8
MVWRGGLGWYGRVLAAAVGLTAVAVTTSVWSAQAGPVESRPERPESSARPWAPSAQGPARAPMPVSIAHASDRGARGVNITVDDGPDPVWTPRVLDVLREYGVKATFCMVGTEARAHPDLVKKVVAAGHRLCDHTVSHDTAMDTKSESYQSRQILDAERRISKASG